MNESTEVVDKDAACDLLTDPSTNYPCDRARVDPASERVQNALRAVGTIERRGPPARN